jgi:formate hydrogenlyase subunit 2
VPGIRAVAVKCDLCSFDEQGPACVRTCPTKALILVNIRDIARTSKRKRELTKYRFWRSFAACRRLTRGRNERDDDD